MNSGPAYRELHTSPSSMEESFPFIFKCQVQDDKTKNKPFLFDFKGWYPNMTYVLEKVSCQAFTVADLETSQVVYLWLIIPWNKKNKKKPPKTQNAYFCE